MTKAVSIEHIESEIQKIDSRIDRSTATIERLKVERQALSRLLKGAKSAADNRHEDSGVPLRLTDAVRQFLETNGPASRRMIVASLKSRVHSGAQNVERSLQSTISTLLSNGDLVEREDRRLMVHGHDDGNGNGDSEESP